MTGVLLSLTLLAGPPDPALLSRLAEADARLNDLYESWDYRVLTHTDHLDGEGEVVKTTDVETRLFTRPDGKPWEEISRFVDGGKDVTAEHEKKRERLLAAGRKRSEDFPFKSPFGAAQQTGYEFADLGPVEGGPGRERIGFAAQEKAQDAYVGEAEVDLAAGALRRITFHPTAFPHFVHRVDVELRFDQETPAGWALTHLAADAEGGALWVKRHVKMETRIVDYAPPALPEVAASGTPGPTATPQATAAAAVATPPAGNALAPK